ncbi:MAG: TrkH family potassium uptake protein [Clostridia bacterium]|nr:TrkH family potassium uptake protein [Clostridia bacterium]
MNYKIIMHTLGWVLNIEAAAMLLPLICAAVYGEPYVLLFAFCILLCLIFGLPLTIKAPKKKSMYAREGFIAVALSWIVLSIFGALPFYISGFIPSFIDALFETVSGFTTTGASILTDVEALPKSLLFWRSFTHWIGGMGVLVFLVAILPLSGGNNLYLIKAESPGPAVSKLVPKVKSTAKILYQMYLVMTLIEIALLLLGGVTLFDALTLSFGTAGTGGFGILNSSIADYSPYVQVVITIFMILFGIDFSLYYLLLLRKVKDVLHSDELRAYLGIILCSIAVIVINCRGLFSTLSETIRHAAFQVGSIITTTGYSTTDFDKWPELSKTILVTLMFIGACAGSTGGGIKVSRIIIFVKSIFKELITAVHPNSVRKITLNKRPVEHEVVRVVNVYMAAYIMIFVTSILIISIDNFDFTTNFTAIAATLNNIGPGLNAVGPTQNFSIYSPLSTLVFIADMLIGRLEIFPLLLLFTPPAWRK